MDYPDNCIKGIPNAEHLTSDGTPATHLFFFSKEDRGDGWKDQSINWDDDDQAIKFTLKQLRNGNLQFRSGAAVIPRSEIERLNRQPAVQKLLSYERQPFPENTYHGNILLSAQAPIHLMRQIAASLALVVSHQFPPCEA